MFTSLLRRTADDVVTRPGDRRPLYRRIFTNYRLDILHKCAVRSIFCFCLWSVGYLATKSAIYVKYIRPAEKEQREYLEAELIAADRAGFKIRMIRARASAVLTFAAASYANLFAFGALAGAGFELFKIKFSFNGVTYYTVFKKKQLVKELEEFERGLKELDDIITSGKPAGF